MDPAEWFWTVVGVLIVLRVAYSVYNRMYGITGRHHTHYWDSDMSPPHGSVWMRGGEWYTQPRRDWAQPRKFESRSNPLDHEYRWEKVQVPAKFIDVPREVEY